MLFTKPAVPGRVKTRLARDLGEDRAAALHLAFVDDVAESLAVGPWDRWVLWAPVDDRPEPPRLDGWSGAWQQGEDLGERLNQGLVDAARGADAVAAVGSDHPGLDAARIEEAFSRLRDGADVALGPATDGGYYLLAARSAALHRRLFDDVPWSTETVAAVTLERCEELGHTVAVLPEERDVDEIADLRTLAERLVTAGDEIHCPRTRELLDTWGFLAEVHACAC